ncbi:MAG: GNAT family N-acetyltransferase [Pseudonocardia sp.]|nr:GNAT family N-acetyltransferase [Pseudonocardia sp.]
MLTRQDAAGRPAWDALVERTPGTDVTQLSAWTRVRGLSGFSARWVLAERDGELVGGAQLLDRRVPVLGRVSYVPYGPVVPPGTAGRAEIVRALADVLAGPVARDTRALFVQPPEAGADLSAALLARGFRPSGAGIAPAGSIRIDLGEDLDVIRGRFGRRLRSWTNRWEGRGVRVRRGGEADVPLLADLMEHTAAQQGYSAFPAGYVRTLYRELASTGNAELFVGEVDGVPVAADLVTRCGGMVRGRLTGFDRSGEAGRLSVPAAIRWEIIRWGKAAGLRWLDFGGLRPATLDALDAGDGPPPEGWLPVDQPKLTFGGTPFRYPQAVELISPRPLRAGYDLVLRSPAGRHALESARALLREVRRTGPRTEVPA